MMMGTKRGLNGPKRRKLQTVCNYLEKNLPRMRYDEYLAAGYPIASGVIEGACRYVVKEPDSYLFADPKHSTEPYLLRRENRDSPLWTATKKQLHPADFAEPTIFRL